MKGFWTCTRVTAGVPCKRVNSNRRKKCERCGKLRAPRKRAKHLAALDASYETFVELNGGEFCGICGKTESGPAGHRFHRDHDHRSGKIRGLLCFRCNAALRDYMTLEWLENAAAYVSRTDRDA